MHQVHEELRGIISKITFRKEDTGFSVASLKTATGDQVCIVGQFIALACGEQLICKGTWQQHASFGKQFKVVSHQRELPQDAASIELYLASDYVKGIGPVYAKRIVKRFGTETLKVLDHQSERLREVEGVGQKRLEQIRESWQEHKAFRDLLFCMQKVGLSSTYAQRIYAAYKHHAQDIIMQKPYQLAKDIWGIGFLKADDIALKQGIAKESSERIRAGLDFVLLTASQQGHTCLKKEQLCHQACQLLGLDLACIEDQLQQALQERYLIQSLVPAYGEVIVAAETHACELELVEHIQRLSSATLRNYPSVDVAILAGLTDHQQHALLEMCGYGLVVLTGGPGTGKSTVTAKLVKHLESLGVDLALVAPTGKAAKRLQELTQVYARTIHNLLQYNPRKQNFRFNKQDPLELDWLIVDEVSMLDLNLAHALLQAVKTGSRVIFVGDPDQLPSVGPGHVLRDLLMQDHIPHVTLSEVFRQAAGSQIIQCAHAIKEGVLPDFEHHQESDCFFIEEEDPQNGLLQICDLVFERLPKAYGLDALRDIQVLSPQHRGFLGTQALNVYLQARAQQLKPNLEERPSFMKGDKLIQLHNNYDKEVFNGDVGCVIDMDNGELIVSFDGRERSYSTKEQDELALAYCITIHKFQGSECPCIVLPVHNTHYQMLSRNLFYTGVTRGKRLVVMIGQKKALWIASQKASSVERQTRLWHLLKSDI